MTMKKILASLTVLTGAALVSLLLVGCGKSGPAPLSAEGIDLQAELQRLQSNVVTNRQDALARIARLGPKAKPAVPQLIKALKDPDQVVRQLAAYALGQIGPDAKEAVPALKEAFQSDPAMKVKTAALNALRAIDPNAAPKVKVQNI